MERLKVEILGLGLHHFQSILGGHNEILTTVIVSRLCYLAL